LVTIVESRFLFIIRDSIGMFPLVFTIPSHTEVAFFSDPMVDVITRVGLQINIGAFYVSFVITPLCSNASELIASLVFAMSKTKQSASMTYVSFSHRECFLFSLMVRYSQLYGAATMNSTLGLGIFYGLIYFRQLSWTFSAETLAILVITWTVCAVGSFKQNFSCIWYDFRLFISILQYFVILFSHLGLFPA
jgi:Ca2+/Na+ antiporter